MKTTLILASLLIFAAFMGCSDNLNITEPFNNHELGQTKIPGNERNTELICSFEELTVSASTEFSVEEKAVYTNRPLTMISTYWVTFDVHTDANKLTNGYIPQVTVMKDEESVFQSSSYPSADGEVITHEKIALENVRFDKLAIYAALFQGDDPTVRDEDQVTTLKLTNISIYVEN